MHSAERDRLQVKHPRVESAQLQAGIFGRAGYIWCINGLGCELGSELCYAGESLDLRELL